MVCPICRHDAPYTRAQLAQRQQELDRNPTLDIYPCPDCGGTDYMLSQVNLNQAPLRPYDGIFRRELKAGALIPRRSLWYRLLEWWRSLWTS
jgi:uncharacterized protein YbaR (Trm112 family)